MNQSAKVDLEKENISLKREIESLRSELAYLKRIIFGKKSERFLSEEPTLPPNTLFTLEEKEENKIENLTEQISYEREKPIRKRGGRKELPAHLPREIQVIEPEDKKETDRRIGVLVTEQLEFIPGVMKVHRIERPKYIDEQTQKIKIATLPHRPVDKSQFGPRMMTHVIVSKYIDHTPIYRKIEQFKREHDVMISRSSLGESLHQYLDILTPLYELHRNQVLQQTYIQTDETGYKVQSEDKKGTTHLGYMWASRSPVDNLVLFTYQRSRSGQSMTEHLGSFKGKLQVDGYHVYEKLGEVPDMTLFGCWAHARRKFEQASKNGQKEADPILKDIQDLYKIERKCRDEKWNHNRRMLIRQELCVDILNRIKSNLEDLSIKNILPKSTLGEAIGYTLKRWKQLSLYIHHGEVEIDNNLLENDIRPIALGRKNYLFAGSHDSAQRAALIYSFFATCKMHGINPSDWLLDVLLRIKEHHINKLDELLPQNWKPLLI